MYGLRQIDDDGRLQVARWDATCLGCEGGTFVLVNYGACLDSCATTLLVEVKIVEVSKV